MHDEHNCHSSTSDNCGCNDHQELDGSAKDEDNGSYCNRKTSEYGYGIGCGDSDSECDDHNCKSNMSHFTSQGLVGMQNIGNTCYMNAALQALSNTDALTCYLITCEPYVEYICQGNKVDLSLNYLKLIKNIWCNPWYNRNNSIIPSSILNGVCSINSLFRGYQQHDTQEFLRCFMDRLHEELKEQTYQSSVNFANSDNDFNDCRDDSDNLSNTTLSEAEYETCDSGVSERSSLSEDLGTIAYHYKDSGAASGDGVNNFDIDDVRPTAKYHSIISDLFDGKLLSSVECLTCNRISTSIETFQDLSLPIPTRDQLAILHSTNMFGNNVVIDTENLPVYYDDWLNWILDWLKSWFYGPSITLYDCLSAFFSADELKGDNMYSCEKCNKLRNGVKYSKLIELPEILCIHLKRFRHEMNSSSKISNQVTFPLTHLDLSPYIHDQCSSRNTFYDLYAVICHRGGANGGHYICYAFNQVLQNWYEFDDHFVRPVSSEIVQNSEAYVLFYKKMNESLLRRKEYFKLLLSSPDTVTNEEDYCYISKQWFVKLALCSDPGPINNFDFLCSHEKLDPLKKHIVDDITIKIPTEMWLSLKSHFGGGEKVQHLEVCSICSRANVSHSETEIDDLKTEQIHFDVNTDGVSEKIAESVSTEVTSTCTSGCVATEVEEFEEVTDCNVDDDQCSGNQCCETIDQNEQLDRPVVSNCFENFQPFPNGIMQSSFLDDVC